MKKLRRIISCLFLLCLLSGTNESYGQGGPGNANAGGPGNANAGGPGNANAGGPGNANAGGPGNANAGGPGNANAGGPGNANAAGGGPIGIPVDGGLTIFLGLGAAYGAKRIYDVAKNRNTNTK